MTHTSASSPRAAVALRLALDLQARFARSLESVAARHGSDEPLRAVSWVRDEGRHGGGTRYVAVDTPVFNRAAINVSGVHYDDEADRALSSATALSTIIHPQHPRAPSVHMHISWTEMRDGSGYWRLMADLNPAIENDADTRRFADVLARVAPEHLEHARAQGDRYFFIPSLKRHRGVCHFYLEGFNTGDFDADANLARSLGEAVIDEYVAILADALAAHAHVEETDRAAQLRYHTAYLLQVLTLDRGTTSGLLVHNQNDVGILGSLPARVDRELLASWIDSQRTPQDELLRAIVAALPDEHPCTVDDETRQVLARVIREHYRAHPEGLDMQAAADIVPPTVANHR